MFCNTPGSGAAEEHAAIDKQVNGDDWLLEATMMISEQEPEREAAPGEEICTESYCHTNWKPMRRN